MMDARPMIIVAALIVVDFFTGLFYAIYSKTFKSSVMREGGGHKLAELLAMGMLYALEYALPMLGVSLPLPLVSCGAVYLALMEIGSIFENLGKVNPEISAFLNDTLKKIKHEEGGDDGV